MNKRLFFLIALFVSSAAFAQSNWNSLPKGLYKCSTVKISDYPRNIDEIHKLSDDCLSILDSEYNSILNKKYKNLSVKVRNNVFKSYLIELRKKHDKYMEVICSDPVSGTDLKSSSDGYIYRCRIQQQHFHFKALEEMEKFYSDDWR